MNSFCFSGVEIGGLLLLSLVALAIGWNRLYSDYSLVSSDKDHLDEGWSWVHRTPSHGNENRETSNAGRDRVFVSELMFSRSIVCFYALSIVVAVSTLSPIQAFAVAFVLGYLLKTTTHVFSRVTLQLMLEFLGLSFFTALWLKPLFRISCNTASMSSDASFTRLSRAFEQLTHEDHRRESVAAHQTVRTTEFTVLYYTLMVLAISGAVQAVRRLLAYMRATSENQTHTASEEYSGAINLLRQDFLLRSNLALFIVAAGIWYFWADSKVKFAVRDDPYAILGIPHGLDASEVRQAYFGNSNDDDTGWERFPRHRYEGNEYYFW